MKLLPSITTSTVRRHLLRWARGILVGMVLATGFLYFAQRGLLYYPGSRLTQEEFQRKVAGTFKQGALVLPGFDAIVLEPPAGTHVVATAVWFHGNAGLGGQRGATAPVFRDRGIRLVLAEYPGYGARPGPPTEQALVEDAGALLAELFRRYPGEPLLLVGESLGTGVAVQLAATPGVNPARLVLLTPYMSIAQVAAEKFWLLPWARFFVRDTFDSARFLPAYSGPVSLVVAANDEVVGAEQGRQLAAVAKSRPEGPERTTLIELSGEGHNTWRYAMDEAKWTAILGFPPVARPSPPTPLN